MAKNRYLAAEHQAKFF